MNIPHKTPNFQTKMFKTKILAAIVTVLMGTSLVSAGFAKADQSSPAPNSPAGARLSYNWAGYVATGGTFTGVAGTWTIPQPSSQGQLTADATWVGIGGVSSQDLIQTGTQAIVESTGGITYQAWYELLPNNSIQVPMAVNPGDSITGTIARQNDGTWLISLHDNSNGQSYQNTVNYDSTLSSAEWVQEMPSMGSAFVPLDNFGTVNFTNGTATENGTLMTIAGANSQPMTMVNSQVQPLASPSALNPDGMSFSVTRTDATVTTAVNTDPFGTQWFRIGRGEQGFGTGTQTSQPDPSAPAPPATIPTDPTIPQGLTMPTIPTITTAVPHRHHNGFRYRLPTISFDNNGNLVVRFWM